MYFLTLEMKVFSSFSHMWGLSTVPLSVCMMQQKFTPLVMMEL